MEMITQIASIVLVLGMLLGARYWLARNGARLPLLRARAAAHGRAQMVESLRLSHQHSLHVVRIDDSILVLALHPSGCTLLQSRRDGSVAPRTPLAGGPAQQILEEIA